MKSPGEALAQGEVEEALADAVRLFEPLLAAHGVEIFDDHDPTLATGAFEPRGRPLGPSELRIAMRSWERFDRSYRPIERSAEEQPLLARLRTLLSHAAAPEGIEDLLSRHLYRLDRRWVLSLPAETFARLLRRGRPKPAPSSDGRASRETRERWEALLSRVSAGR